jgi:hypothetical protein
MSPKVLFTCFAGRERYLRVLVPYVQTLVSRNLVHEVHFWDYTRDPKDAEYIRTLPFQVLIPETKAHYGNYYEYYTCAKYPEPDTVLIKCDDDIVYIDVDAFDRFISDRRKHTGPIFFSPCVINNSVCSILMEQQKLLPMDINEDMYGAKWACEIHKYFLKNIESLKTKSRGIRSVPPDIEWRFNINFLAFLAKDFDTVFKSPHIMEDDEYYFGVFAPKHFSREYYIDMRFFVSHMAYTAQRTEGFDETNFLQKYHDLSISHTRSSGGSVVVR